MIRTANPCALKISKITVVSDPGALFRGRILFIAGDNYAESLEFGLEKPLYIGIVGTVTFLSPGRLSLPVYQCGSGAQLCVEPTLRFQIKLESRDLLRFHFKDPPGHIY